MAADIGLRKLLGKADAVVQRDGRVALNSCGLFVDVWALERLLDSRSGAGGGAPPRAPPAPSVSLHAPAASRDRARLATFLDPLESDT